ncbi:MAG: peptidase M56 family protein [Acidobacteria bacterium]|nr:peptidase M56 family protein [Acidobacteriota bacterium]
MSTLEMDPVFTAALREALVTTVNNTPRVRRRWRWRLGTGTFVGLTLVAGGIAVAAGVFSPPGAPIDTSLGNVVSATRTGTATIALGAPPAGATSLSLALRCLSVGTFYFPNGSSMSCNASDMSHQPPINGPANEVVPLSPGVDTVTIRTSANASWTLRVAYVNQVTTSWGVNAIGETYGVTNQQGTPDLIAVVIDQGQTQGYVESSELNCASGGDVTSPAEALAWDKVSQNRNVSIPVYESDGTTVIGTFIVGNATGVNASTVPLSSLSLGCSTP